MSSMVEQVPAPVSPVRLVCGHRGARRPVTVFTYAGPLPPGWSPRLRGSTFELACAYCGFAPRPGDEGLRALIELAAARPGAVLDINPG